MKDIHKKRYVTKAKTELFNAIMEDKPLQRMMGDVLNAGIGQPQLIVLVDYIYHMGYEKGYLDGVKHGKQLVFGWLQDIKNGKSIDQIEKESRKG